MAREVTINDLRDIQVSLKNIERKFLIVNKNQITIEKNSEILKKNFLDFKRNVLESVKDVLKDIDKKRDNEFARKYDRFERKALSDIEKNVKAGIKKAKTREMDKMIDNTFKRVEKRLSVLEEFVDEKVATSKLLTKKFDDERRDMQDHIDSKISKETDKMEMQLKELAKHEKDQDRFVNMMDSVKDDINAVVRERKSQQKSSMDFISTIEELRERMDMMDKDTIMNIKLLENKMIERIDDDVATMIGDSQDIKDRIKRLEKQ
ncbi:MAG: hypothetical protein GOV02_01100 [Candidatus Aenigmarchaeota archaeon]|nr:hypothetical protein [Candidatus Aenigmarchaeota archaeon]